ncbi:MAG: DEAD/DEAH box helicase, partial [Bacteroidales bacterium]
MNATVFNKDIKYLPGVGPKRAKLLSEELNIRRYGDLLYYFPYKYIDRTRFYNIKDVHPDLANIQIKGKIVKFELAGKPNKRRLIGYFADETGLIKLVWFRGINWIKKSYSLDKDYVIFGKPTVFNQQINIIHPEIESLEEYNSRIQQGLEAHYNTTERLKKNYINSKVIRKLQNNLLQEVKDKIGETLPEKLINQLKLNALNEALIHIHFPQNRDQLLKAQYRLKFEELFYVELNILEQKNTRIRKFSGFNFEKVGALFNSFYNKKLPFKLTNAQKKVLKEIRRDLGSGLQMNRLLQGDVGSGKTLVALMSILIALDNNYQSCIMAPTEILANQHYESITRFLDA